MGFQYLFLKLHGWTANVVLKQKWAGSRTRCFSLQASAGMRFQTWQARSDPSPVSSTIVNRWWIKTDLSVELDGFTNLLFLDVEVTDVWVLYIYALNHFHQWLFQVQLILHLPPVTCLPTQSSALKSGGVSIGDIQSSVVALVETSRGNSCG